jgi:hypothetical protein
MTRIREFQIFHRSNPKVYKLFKKFALDAKDWGRKRFGARFIWERMRWYIHIETKDSKFKLNDHFPPFYARKLMRDVPARSAAVQFGGAARAALPRFEYRSLILVQ